MAPLPSAVDKCLNSRYQYMLKARNDIKGVVFRYKTLIPKVETFIFNDGSSKELVCLEGTIPVRYKGNVYNFPIQIWVQDTHPYQSPICYVRPTPTMQIKVSSYVDESGRVYLPYLRDWNVNNGSDLLGVIQVMILVFGETPPVFSKPANAAPPPQPATTTPYPAATGGFPLPYPNAQHVGPAYPNRGYNSNNNTLSITDEHIRMSLLSAVESRITQRALEFEQKFKAEEEVLKKTNEELSVGKAKLQKLMGDMENDCREMEANLTILREKNEQLQQAIDHMAETENGGVDIDQAVTATTPLYKQLVNAYAEENAVEDTIYYFGEGLRKGVIDLDTFLKNVRELSRKQFMLRALMQKCRQKAGLPPI